MIKHTDIDEMDVRRHIKNHTIHFGGNQKLKIYGTLRCMSGNKMKRENRIFFETEAEALKNGFRPCGNCMQTQYKNWKNGFIQ